MPDLDTANRRAVVTRKGGARDVTDLPGGPYTLHQLRHSGLTHAAEDGASTPMLMALSGHTSVRSLAKYARVSAEALGRWQAERDPAGRRAGGRR
ncbi:tyrosine-type recombinase/integrase [Streptosporangium canum]|uniref:tyrosine-type recombinase/integrase n=1 Tax=Streptosporangium canum TaxID=324952 RepID=UPI0034314632